jgi:hypothetical protein
MESYTDFKEILKQTQKQLAKDRKLPKKSNLIKRIEAMNSHPYSYKNVIGDE